MRFFPVRRKAPGAEGGGKWGKNRNIFSKKHFFFPNWGALFFQFWGREGGPQKPKKKKKPWNFRPQPLEKTHCFLCFPPVFPNFFSGSGGLQIRGAFEPKNSGPGHFFFFPIWGVSPGPFFVFPGPVGNSGVCKGDRNVKPPLGFPFVGGFFGGFKKISPPLFNLFPAGGIAFGGPPGLAFRVGKGKNPGVWGGVGWGGQFGGAPPPLGRGKEGKKAPKGGNLMGGGGGWGKTKKIFFFFSQFFPKF